MKKKIGAILLAMCVSSAASAWECKASSSSGYGWGRSAYRLSAMRIAMHQCQLRTSRFDWCFVDFCN